MKTEPTSRVRWILVFWIFVLNAVSYLDRLNISFAGISIAHDFNLTNVQLGWVFSAFPVGYALFQTPAGWLSDRLGSRRVLTIGVLWWGIFTGLTATVPSRLVYALPIFIAMRFLLGVGESIISPAANQFVSQWIPSNERGRAIGWIFAGVGAGACVASPLITYLIVHMGWRWSFWICAAIGILAGGVWYVISRNTPEEHPWVSPAELATIRSGLAIPGGASAATVQIPNAAVPWRTILASKDVWAITFSYSCFGYVAWIFFTWFYIYLAKVRGLNLRSSAFYAMLPFLAMAIFCTLGGLIGDQLTKWHGKRVGRCGFAIFSMLLAGAFLAFGSSVENARVATVVLAGGAGALYLATGSFWSTTADISGASSGSVAGLVNMGAQMGGAITASLTPAIASRYGWTASFAVAAALCVLGALAWLFVDPHRHLAPEASPVTHPAKRIPEK